MRKLESLVARTIVVVGRSLTSEPTQAKVPSELAILKSNFELRTAITNQQLYLMEYERLDGSTAYLEAKIMFSDHIQMTFWDELSILEDIARLQQKEAH